MKLKHAKNLQINSFDQNSYQKVGNVTRVEHSESLQIEGDTYLEINNSSMDVHFIFSGTYNRTEIIILEANTERRLVHESLYLTLTLEVSSYSFYQASAEAFRIIEHRTLKFYEFKYEEVRVDHIRDPPSYIKL